MRKIPRTRLAPEDLAVIAYHEDNGDLVILRFIWTRARYTLCVPLYYRLRSRVIMPHRQPHLICFLNNDRGE